MKEFDFSTCGKNCTKPFLLENLQRVNRITGEKQNFTILSTGTSLLHPGNRNVIYRTNRIICYSF